jgi:hypothetical protein
MNKFNMRPSLLSGIVSWIKRQWFLFVVTIAIVVAVVGLAAWFTRGDTIGVHHNDKIDITPVQVESIRKIGQWEFLSVSDEEMVDTVRHGFFSDDELSRIYYGTLRLGVDLREAPEDWIKMDHDTVTALLPPVKLLDENFLDEAQTRTFYESGHWSETDKAALTARAQALMRSRCLTPANIRSAEQNACTQVSATLHAMGFEWVRVRFKK